MKCIHIQVYDSDRNPISHPYNKDESEVIPMPNIPSDKLAKVKYSMGITINIGNFQSAKVDIGIELPTHVDDVESSYESAMDFCQGKFGEEVVMLENLKKAVK